MNKWSFSEAPPNDIPIPWHMQELINLTQRNVSSDSDVS